ncbi:MAG TPA: hypothetical protein VGR57_19120 [Ktedonobacterales bacterium]|nr:hypothetical protein [Ktedonobacterales bacterium]
MKLLAPTLLVIGTLLPMVPAQADDAQGFDVLRTMSVADFRATGLDHLTDAQIKALDAWFADYQRSHSPCASGTTAPVMAAPETPPAPAGDMIVAHLDGTFTGWGNNTVFKLDNGQVWEQVDDSVLNVGAIKNPRVTIKKGLISAYYLSVEGVNDSVPVRRIKP